MELLWYDIRQLDEETMAQTMAMMDEARRRRVGDIAGEDDRKRTSVLEKLKAPSVHGAGEKKKSHEQEAR